MDQNVARRSQPRGRLAWFGRGIVVVVLVAAMAVSLRGPAWAQNGGGSPSIGTAVPFVGLEGGTLAEITIETVEDPFQDYDPNSVPQRAFHFVVLTISVENTGNRPFPFDPNAVAIQDGQGFLTRPIYLPRTEASMAALPDYLPGEIAPGDTSSGALAFQVLNGAGLQNVVYLPASDRLVVLADLTSGTGAAPTADDAEDTDTDTDAGADATPAASADDDTDGESADTAASSEEIDCDLAASWATGTGERLDAIGLLVAEMETFDRETADPVRLAEIAARVPGPVRCAGRGDDATGVTGGQRHVRRRLPDIRRPLRRRLGGGRERRPRRRGRRYQLGGRRRQRRHGRRR